MTASAGDSGEGAPGLSSSQLVRRPTPAGVLLRLSGLIDQTFDGSAFARSATGVTVVDLQGVERITSFGASEWARATEQIRVSYLGFINVRPAMLSQFNVVARFGGAGQVVSLYAPYLCASCGHVLEQLIDLRKQYETVLAAEVPDRPCPKCRGAMNFDDLPRSYFAHVSSLGPPSPPPEFDAVAEGRIMPPRPAEASLKVEVEVEQDTTLVWLSGTLDGTARFRRIVETLEGVVVVMLEGLTAVHPGGLAQLATLRAYQGELHCARLPSELAGALAQDPAGATVGLGTWLLRAVCPACHAQIRVEVFAQSQTPQVACPSCGVPTALPALAPPPGARAYPAELLRRLMPRVGPRRHGERSAFMSRYELLKPLGSGGMGEVFLARMTGAGGFEKSVALKHIRPGTPMSRAATEALLAEARLAARLTHPNVVQILDVGAEQGEFFVAMEYVKGLDLRLALSICREQALMIPLGVALRVVGQLCAALEAAHTYVGDDGRPAVIVHRDVSPHNVLLSVDGAVKLTDFGIAKMADDPNQTPSSVTKGKLAYLAPEQVQLSEERKVEPASDIFTTGVLFFQALSLVQPFTRENEYATLKAIVSEAIPSVRSYRPEAPAAIDQIIATASAKDPRARYASIRQMREAIEQVQAREGLLVTQTELAAWVNDMMLRARLVRGRGPGSTLTPSADQATRSLPVVKRTT